MGDLAYGKSFDMLKTGESHWAIKVLRKGIGYMGAISPAIWLVILFTHMPIVTRDFSRFLTFCEEMMEERMKQEKDVPDISTWILKAPSMPHSGFTDKGWIVGDSRLIIVAGSDTTAGSLTYLFYHLVNEPVHVEKLRQELQHLNGDFSASSLRNLPYLNALINESLRLNHPVPSGVQRMTPPEGLTIGTTYIPGNVNIIVPFYSILRCELKPLHDATAPTMQRHQPCGRFD